MEPWKSRSTPPASGTDVCAAADVLDGKARVVPFGSGAQRVELIVAREGACVYGYINECAHNSVPLNLLDDLAVTTYQHRLVCDDHRASFRFADGYCVEGPCEGESLTAVPLALAGDRVVVATPPAP